MNRLRDLYGSISFRGRLLLLLVAVSCVQVGVAAYTFFDLQAKPAEQRVQAQLNAALRGIAPVIDAEMTRSSDHLRELLDDPELEAAIAEQDWTTVQQLIGSSADAFPEDAFPEDALADGELPVDAGGFAQPEEAADVEAVEQSPETPLAVYVTDGSGSVVAGQRPEGALVEQPGVNTSRISRGAALLGTVHVPIAVNQTFIKQRISSYVPEEVDVFVADERHVVTSASDRATVPRPDTLREGMREIELAGAQQLALSQPLLDGSVLVGASMSADAAAEQRSQGMGSLWGFIVLLGALTIIVSIFITRAVADTLRRFAEIARDLAGGRLERRIPVTGSDEIAVLSTSFNEMAENLEDRIASLEDARARMRRQVDLFGEALANATDISEMLQAVCSLAMESTSATHARFWTVNDDGRYEHAACIGLRPSDTSPCGLEKEVPVRNASVMGDGDPAWLVVPARMRDGQIVGLLTLVSTAEPFSQDDVRVAERIALQAAVAIDNARLHEQLREQATRDGLTGLPNHRSLQDELARRLAEAHDSGMPLGVCMLDIDNFKRVNDTYGHPIGDEAIKAIGRTLAHGIGDLGMVGRYGGEEFVVIMPGCDADAAVRIADRLREDITTIEVPLEDGGILKVTSSFGVANTDQQHAGVRIDNAELLHQADVGMYNAKRTGKNRVSLAGPDTVVVEMSDVEKAKLAARERGDVAGEQAAAAALETPAASADPFDLAA